MSPVISAIHDYNNVGFCAAMHSIDSYRARYGDTKGSSRV